MLFHVVNLGCKVNKVESDSFAALCLRAGLERGALEQADVVIVNTCAVTAEAEKKTRKTVRHVCRANDHARVFVTGCSAALHASVYQGMSDRIAVLGKAEAAAEIEAFLASSQRRCMQKPDALALGEGFRTRVGIKVQDGCNNACTYCIVHVARGRATSRPAEQILSEIGAYARAGVKEFVLTGINLGSYNQVYQGKHLDLAGLLRLLLAETAACVQQGAGLQACAPRFRIGSIEPADVSDELIELMASAHGRICRHLHVPLQAGSSKVLSEMNRPYSACDYLNLVAKLRAAMPSVSLSTDVIVGFPGETEADFEETCAVARASGFSKIHIFPYSPRAGTPAAQRADQVGAPTKTLRVQALRAVAGELARQDRENRAGTTEWAIVESNGTAMTESYYGVSCDKSCPVGSAISYTF